ncbi:Fic/DOC family protein [Rhodothalassium salexigens DSM 2132]|uniref:Fic/DOC family protein n=1 Tax=Rhodothalassium salexigens DSM 2132 TaxID=1188247 RepID=A0A4R2P6C9_RHOSA|nr:Fic/DOC family protein [Rhodothalassium salexigens DSM 2132]
MGQRVAISTAGEGAEAFVPPPLPPVPSVRMDRLYRPLERANRAIGRLDGVTSILPDTPLFLQMYVRKEALLSSQIESTQSSLSDLLQQVLENGDWEAWLEFFLDGIAETSLQASEAAREILALFEADRHRIEDLGIVREVTGKQCGRLYVYSDYLDILSRGTEPL